jgi:GT2 family glycosyltransferase
MTESVLESRDNGASKPTLALTREELLAGVALRVVGCELNDDGFEGVDLRCISTLRRRHEIVVASSGGGSDTGGSDTAQAMGAPLEGCRVVLRASRDVQPPAGWKHAVEEEYSVIVPKDAGDLLLRCAVRSKELGRVTLSQAKRKALLQERFDARCNPFADERYPIWLAQHQQRPSYHTAVVPKEGDPLFSLVCPVFRTPERYLHEMIDSVLAQTYPRWELVLVNASPDDATVARVLASYSDERISIVDHPENDGINRNTNVGIAASTGDFVCFLDHDDKLEPDTLALYRDVLASHPETDVIYCDEDSFDNEGNAFLPIFKPDFDLSLLHNNNYLTHAGVSRRALDMTLRSPDETNGAQDYDIALKCVEIARRIEHVPYVLYRFRAHQGSINAGNTAAKPYVVKASIVSLKAHFERLGLACTVQEEPVPFVFKTLIVPKSACSVSVVVDPCERRQFDELRGRLALDGVEFLRCEQTQASPFARIARGRGWGQGHEGSHDRSLAALRNAAARKAQGDLLLFVSAGDEPFTEAFLDTLRSYLERREVGMVVPELLLPGGQRVDAGWVLCADGSLTQLNQGMAPWDGGYNGHACRPHEWTVVNPAMQLVRREEFLALDGYDEGYRTLAYASADLCLRYRRAGLAIVYTPYAAAFHSEPSQTPLAAVPQAVVEAQEADREKLRACWLTPDWVDPCYNPNLDPKSPFYQLKW